MFQVSSFKFYEIMLQSKLFYKTTKPSFASELRTGKEKSVGEEAISSELLTRAGFADQLMA